MVATASLFMTIGTIVLCYVIFIGGTRENGNGSH